ncbi:unnamed protein product [Schistosoma margrebowiei]|uniref:Uncharacterized protein n=1 Tax=Schistosoma margrebowiei TaxID=48269 RepID=A0A183MRE1_9TREM|nr:unnamed protein product [Schistosoma margrebowiei]
MRGVRRIIPNVLDSMVRIVCLIESIDGDASLPFGKVAEKNVGNKSLHPSAELVEVGLFGLTKSTAILFKYEGGVGNAVELDIFNKPVLMGILRLER